MDGRLIFLHHARRSMGPFAGRKGVGPLDWTVPAMGEAVHVAEAPGRTAKKSRPRTSGVPVLKLTQVGEMNILRRSRERS